MKNFVITALFILFVLTSFKQDEGLSVSAFQKKINGTDKVVLVYFNADWCIPCVKLKPSIEQIKAEEKDGVMVLDLDVDKNPALGLHFEINTLPLFIIYKNGKKMWENNTALTKADLVNKLGIYKEKVKK
jgi:thioredoxin 1